MGYLTFREGIKSLLARPWFTRVWILQEAVNARAGLVCCGSKAVLSRVFIPSDYVNHPDQLGLTPLIWAAREGHTDVVVQLLQAGAKANHQDRSGQTALACAAFKGHAGVVDILLLEKYTTQTVINLLDREGKNALCLASIQGHLQIVRLLAKRKAAQDMRCSFGRTPLFWAVLKEHQDVVEFLISAGADINATENGSIYRRNNIKYVWATETGAPPSPNGQTMLGLAIEAGNREIFTRLVEGGADVNARDGEGRTPLGRACERSVGALVRTLLENGADVGEDGTGRTPMEWARMKKHQPILLMLKHHYVYSQYQW